MTPEEQEKIDQTATLASAQKSLELLFDYTKFHIGLYLTLTASYVAVASIKVNEKLSINLNRCLIWPAVACFMLAGLAGGVIASSLTQTPARSSQAFLELSIGPWEIKWLQLKARVWTWIEHTAFWVGLLFAAFSALTK